MAMRISFANASTAPRANSLPPGYSRRAPRPRSTSGWMDSDVQGGPVGELLAAAVERPALDQLEVEVRRTLEDRPPV